MSQTDFERNDGLDDLDSDDLERLAFDESRPSQLPTKAPSPIPEKSRPQLERQPRPTKYCHACGNMIDKEAEICMGCGVRQHSNQPQPQSVNVNVTNTNAVTATATAGSDGEPKYALNKSRTVAAVLAILLGGLGAHKFYLGKWIQGLVYLVFVWTWIPIVVGFIEGILYLMSDDRTFARKYGARVH